MNQFKKILLNFAMFLFFTTQQASMQLPNSGTVTWPQNSVTTIISNLSSQNFLPYPYSSLQQDPTSGVYVLVSSIPTYTFFNVPNSYTDANGNPIQIGAVYDVNGNLLNTIQGAQLTSLLAQCGVAIDSSGNQYLGACNLQPMMILDPADVALSPGVSGKSMIYSSNPAFPSIGITSPITYNNSRFYFYYNNIMQTYFVMQVTGNIKSYVNINTGSCYNLDGSSQVAGNPVGIPARASSANLFLPYLNADGFLQCIMLYNGTNNSYSDFSNTESSFQATNVVDPSTSKPAALNALVGLSSPYNKVNVYQMPLPTTPIPPMPDLSVATQYNVYWNPPIALSYIINPSYQWQNLQILPIDMNTRAMLNPKPANMYSRAGIVLKNNAISAFVFAGQLFSASLSSQNSYRLSSGANQMTMTINVDSKTNIKYISTTDGTNTYNYQYPFLALSVSQLQNYQSNAWLVGQTTDINGNVLLVKSLPVNSSGNVQLTPVNINSVQNIPTDPTAKSSLTNNISTIAQDVANNRFLTMVFPATSGQTPSFSYVNQNCYVDLATGILFTTQGILAGATLQLADLNSLLTSLSVVVVNSSNKAVLTYSAAPSVVPTPSTTPAASTLPNSSSTTTTTSASTSNTATPTQVPAVSPTVQLQQQNSQLQADITNRQNALNSLQKERGNNPNIKNQIQINQNAITVDQQQIAANNTLISSLQASAANPTSQSRSTLLGRMKSNKAKKKRVRNNL